MTTNIPQTSASERQEAARKALEVWTQASTTRGVPLSQAIHGVVAALRALITPPGIHESEEQLAIEWRERLMERGSIEVIGETGLYSKESGVYEAEIFRLGVRAGIQAAHESWEPADVPSQEFMLRRLGIDYEEHRESLLFIPEQSIEKEVI